ncbi:MAG: hypothetical protein ACK55I_00940, partial [bacterium]
MKPRRFRRLPEAPLPSILMGLFAAHSRRPFGDGGARLPSVIDPMTSLSNAPTGQPAVTDVHAKV